MKKYMAPVTEIIDLEASSMICGSNGERMGDIGAGGTGSDYANPNWDNQGNNGLPTDSEDDDGELNSTAKSNDVIVDDDNW